MKLVLDLQGAQSSGSRTRGIGRYSIALAKALIECRSNHEVVILLNSSFAESIHPIREEFSSYRDGVSIHVWSPPSNVRYLANCPEARKIAAIIRENVIISLRADAVITTSFFEGIGDDSYSTVLKKDHGIIDCITLHDIIPYLYPENCLGHSANFKWYHEKVSETRDFSMIFAISESAKEDAIKHFQIDPKCIVNTSSDASEYFRVIPLEESKVVHLKAKFGITKEIVMYTGGMDFRKNGDGLIRAYAKVSNEYRKNHQLVIVCSMNSAQKAAMRKIAEEEGLRSEEVIFTGYVSDEELRYFYNISKLFVFPSLYEGFGLPVLEAMNCGLATIAGNNSSLPEVVGNPCALFDASSPTSIAAKIEEVLGSESFRLELKEYADRHRKRFSMRHSAQMHWDILEKLWMERENTPKHSSKEISKKLLAFVSPVPPAASCIADDSHDLLGLLKDYYDIVIITKQSDVRSDIIRDFSVKNVEWLYLNYHKVDRILYHFGNSDQHDHMLTMLPHLPGVVVLHGFFLSGLYNYLDGNGHLASQGTSFRNLLQMWHGDASLMEAESEDRHLAIMKYPMNAEVLSNSRGVIVHSRYFCDLASKWYGETFSKDWEVIPHLKYTDHCLSRADGRAQLGIPKGEFLVCSFGNIETTGLNHLTLLAWASSKLKGKGKLVFVGDGDNHYGKELREEIVRLGLKKEVEITGWVSKENYDAYLAAADFAIQLRTDSRGETSGAILDCMKYGLPVIANQNGEIGEILPKSRYLLSDEFEGASLVEAMESLFADEVARSQFGKILYDKVSLESDPKTCAQSYYDSLEKFYQKPNVFRADVVREITERVEGFRSVVTDNKLAELVVDNFNVPYSKCRIFVDISSILQNDFSEEHAVSIVNEVSNLFKKEHLRYSIFLISHSYGEKCYHQYIKDGAISSLEEKIHWNQNDLYICYSPSIKSLESSKAFQNFLDVVGVKKYVWDPAKSHDFSFKAEANPLLELFKEYSFSIIGESSNSAIKSSGGELDFIVKSSDELLATLN
ncbi:MAG: glycosyltransferase [Luteolibacter sp.]